MDPLSALSLACNITQIVEQSIAVGKLIWQIYKTGSIEANDEIEKTTKALENFSISLESSIKSSGSLQYTSAEQQLLKIAPDCTTIAKALLKELDTLKQNAKGGKLHAFVLTTRAIRKRGKVEDYVKKLDEYRKLLETGVVFSIRDQINALSAKQNLQFDNLSTTLKQFLSNLNNDKIWLSGEFEDLRRFVDLGFRKIEDKLDAQNLRQDREKFIASLYFPEMKQRITQIADQPKDEDSCNWIFQDDLPGHWSSYKKWLKGDEQSYWIHGKAGSGKSTLMRSIWDSQELLDILRESSRRNIHVLKHSFLLHGSDLQRNYLGLMCSLLHDVLSEKETMAEMLLIVYPTLKKKQTIGDWTFADMQKLWREIVQEVTESATLCLFLDGMDEIEPQSHHEDRGTIVQLLHDLSANRNVKICVSSRYESPWIQLFQKYPQLRVQDLTRASIENYVTKRIRMASYNFSQLDRRPEDEQELVKNIVDKADGVFLWVRLAVTSILDLEDVADWKDVEEKVDKLPDGLINLYVNMLQRRSKDSEKAKDEAATYLRLCLEGAALGGSRPTRDLYLHHCLVIRSMFRSSNKSMAYERNWEEFKVDYVEVQLRILNICAGMITFQRQGYLSNSDLTNEYPEYTGRDSNYLIIPERLTWSDLAWDSESNSEDEALSPTPSNGGRWNDYADDIYEDRRSFNETEQLLRTEDLFEDANEPLRTRSVRLQFSHRSVVDFLRDHVDGSSFISRCKMQDLDVLKMSVEADLLRYRLGVRACDPSGLDLITDLAHAYQRTHQATVQVQDVAELELHMSDMILGWISPDSSIEGVSARTIRIVARFLGCPVYYEKRIAPYLRCNTSNGMVLNSKYRNLLLLCAVLSDQPTISLDLVDDGADLGAEFYLPWKICAASTLLEITRGNLSSLEAWRDVIQRVDHSPCKVMIEGFGSLNGHPRLRAFCHEPQESMLFEIDAISQLNTLLSGIGDRDCHGIAIKKGFDHAISVFPFCCQSWRDYFIRPAEANRGERQSLEYERAKLQVYTTKDPIWVAASDVEERIRDLETMRTRTTSPISKNSFEARTDSDGATTPSITSLRKTLSDDSWSLSESSETDLIDRRETLEDVQEADYEAASIDSEEQRKLEVETKKENEQERLEFEREEAEFEEAAESRLSQYYQTIIDIAEQHGLYKKESEPDTKSFPCYEHVTEGFIRPLRKSTTLFFDAEESLSPAR